MEWFKLRLTLRTRAGCARSNAVHVGANFLRSCLGRQKRAAQETRASPPRTHHDIHPHFLPRPQQHQADRGALLQHPRQLGQLGGLPDLEKAGNWYRRFMILRGKQGKASATRDLPDDDVNAGGE